MIDKLIVDAQQISETKCRVAVWGRNDYELKTLSFLEYDFNKTVDAEYVNSLIQAYPLQYVSLSDKRVSRLNIDSLEFNKIMVVLRGKIHLSRATTDEFWRALFDWGVSQHKLDTWKAMVDKNGSTVKPVILKLFMGKDCTARYMRDISEDLRDMAVKYNFQWGIGYSGIDILFVDLVSYAKRYVESAAYFKHTSEGMLFDNQRSDLSLIPDGTVKNDALSILYTNFLSKLTESVRLSI